jgi:short-subunit dehydrogenase
MLERKSGHIVTMSSLGGKKGSPYSATYAATKAGLVEWTSGLRQELKETGVGASVICPGFVSGVGMFAVYKKRAPKIVGETTPEKVAKAVIRAIEKDIQEIIVSPGAIIVMKLLDAIHPAIMSTFLRHTGVYDFYRRQADDNEQELFEADSG